MAAVDQVFERRLAALVNGRVGPALAQGRRGLERETLRVTPDARLSHAPHPRGLGSALSNPHITTDYSEALLELVTPTFTDSAALLSYLEALTQFADSQIGEELLWANSMPCALAGEDDVPIADYGRSHQGMVKSIYRHGLRVRYGGLMQAISGVHFNYSLPAGFWPVYEGVLRSSASSRWDAQRARQQTEGGAQAFVSSQYFGLLRNYRRFGWIVYYLFGASPALSRSFLDRRAAGGLEPHGVDTLVAPLATSLRMSDLGYRNKHQSAVAVSVNSLESYLSDLLREVHEPNAAFAALGLKVDGRYQQLSTNTLQIENEYYSFIRPKRTLQAGERTAHALARGGVEYLEVRALDNDPFEPVGVGLDSLRFLEAFLQYLLLRDSAPIDAIEAADIEANHLAVAANGRDPALRLQGAGAPSMLGRARELLEDMQGVCELLDAAVGGPAVYGPALAAQRAKLEDPARTPSARLIAALDEHAGFAALTLAQSRAQRVTLATVQLDAARREELLAEAEESIRRQRQIEQADRGGFEEFLARYLAD